jgi:DNA polymerase I
LPESDLDDDERLRCDWKQMGAKTGRMSSRAPNLQNLPRGEYRRCFKAPPGRVLIKADYSQIELRIAAKVANEERMIAAYQRGEDLHTLSARQLTGRQEITKQERHLAKPINFGLIYGLGVASLRTKAKAEYGVEMSRAEAERYRNAFFKGWPGIVRWHRQLKAQVPRGVNETRTLTGRRVIVDGNWWYGGRANYILQGTGGDGIKQALGLLWERREEVAGAFPVLVVHDEIVVECAADQAEVVTGWLKQAMVDAMAQLLDPVPVEAEANGGTSWGG